LARLAGNQLGSVIIKRAHLSLPHFANRPFKYRATFNSFAASQAALGPFGRKHAMV
jgi:hypothetical protein